MPYHPATGTLRHHHMALRALFIVAICLGSFLLFLVEPMIARMALPKLGGAPSVWNSAMLVYQLLLLAGYGYAHLIAGLPTRAQRLVHISLFALAALSLPISLGNAVMPVQANPYLWVPYLLLTSIGPVFFIVAAQAPLLQRWYALAGGDAPYPLYAASNLGSFTGLIAYPLIAEPLLTTAQQAHYWSIGYGGLLVLVLACAMAVPGDRVAAETAGPSAVPRPTTRMVCSWLLFATVPSGLMLSTSLHLTTDIVAMPLLWVLPLGLYLLSFSVAFASSRRLADFFERLAPLILLMAGCAAFVDSTPAPFAMAFLALFSLFTLSVALHNRLFDQRPDPTHLTQFYLVMSLGGVIGGLFCALMAPLIFNWAYEYPILLVLAALALKPRTVFNSGLWLAQNTAVAARGRMAMVAGIAVLAALGFVTRDTVTLKFMLGFLIIVITIAGLGAPRLFVAGLVGVMLCFSGWSKLVLSAQDGMMTRSFFGIYSVHEEVPGARSLAHGTTVHGVQNISSGLETVPTAYYAPHSGVGLAMAATPQLFGPSARIDVVGLGVGTLACYAKPAQRWRFYEIDPAVAKIALDARYFSFLQRCRPGPTILIGDARITLAQQRSNDADVLVIDAFSSDSVPMHLLTREAFAIYRRHLQPRGLLMIHISNRYIDLRPVIAAAAKAGWSAALRQYVPDTAGAALNFRPSVWVALSADPAKIAELKAESPAGAWEPLAARAGFAPWEDGYASILPLLRVAR